VKPWIPQFLPDAGTPQARRGVRSGLRWSNTELAQRISSDHSDPIETACSQVVSQFDISALAPSRELTMAPIMAVWTSYPPCRLTNFEPL